VLPGLGRITKIRALDKLPAGLASVRRQGSIRILRVFLQAGSLCYFEVVFPSGGCPTRSTRMNPATTPTRFARPRERKYGNGGNLSVRETPACRAGLWACPKKLFGPPQSPPAQLRETAQLESTPMICTSRRQRSVHFADGSPVVFTVSVSMGNALHQIKHRRDKKDRDERRRQHPADHRRSENLP